MLVQDSASASRHFVVGAALWRDSILAHGMQRRPDGTNRSSTESWLDQDMFTDLFAEAVTQTSVVLCKRLNITQTWAS